MQRYTLDLSEHFSDHRAKIFVRRKQSWKRVQCLLDHVRSTFQIRPECYLTNEADILFPEAEDLDVILETDRIRVRVSNSCGTQQKSAPKAVAVAESRAQNGKRKQVSSSSEDDSSSESDSDDVETLPKIFAGLESVSKSKDTVEESAEVKPKRKRIRKRKSKKVDETPPPKVVVKTYGKTKTPPIVIGNGDATGHVRFDESDKEEVVPVKAEPYRNLNRTVTPRVVKAIQVESVQSWNGDVPAVPEYDGPIEEVSQVAKTGRNRSRKSTKKSVEVKKEIIEAATRVRDPSPTWDSETTETSKETFITNHSGEEFWESLRSSVDNFPTIAVPSVNDVISYGVGAESYLAFVEAVDDGTSDDVSKLALRLLNVTPVRTESATLDQMTAIRLVATYQP